MTQSTVSDDSKELTRMLFRSMKALFTNKFTTGYDTQETQLQAMLLWSVKLEKYSITQVEVNWFIGYMAEQFDWPPTIKQFISAVKVMREQKQLLDPLNQKLISYELPLEKRIENRKRFNSLLREAVASNSLPSPE